MARRNAPEAAAVPGAAPPALRKSCTSQQGVFVTFVRNNKASISPATWPPLRSGEEGTWQGRELGASTFIRSCTQTRPWEHQRPHFGLEIGPVLISQTRSGSQVTPLSLGA